MRITAGPDVSVLSHARCRATYSWWSLAGSIAAASRRSLCGAETKRVAEEKESAVRDRKAAADRAAEEARAAAEQAAAGQAEAPEAAPDANGGDPDVPPQAAAPEVCLLCISFACG